MSANRCVQLSVLAVLLAAGFCGEARARDIDLKRLPLGDNKLSQAPKVGWIWPCRINPGAGGSHRMGPWINQREGTWDSMAKIVVKGAVKWPHKFVVRREGDKRIFVSNDLPNHPTGTFPISPGDPAFQYDRNPNSIRAQPIRIELPTTPALMPQPSCTPGAIGVLLTGVALFNALDAPGRDAVAHETQDSCQGHPQITGVYHYHSVTRCLEDQPGADGHSRVLGYALDGFGIFGNYGEKGRRLASADLDECHGHSHAVEWDGRRVAIYHYHTTPDFPYTVGCMRGAYSREHARAIAGPPPGPRRGPPAGHRPPP